MSLKIEEEVLSPKRARAKRYLETYSSTFNTYLQLEKITEQLDSRLVNITQQYEAYQGGSSSKSDIAQIIVNIDTAHNKAKIHTASFAAALDDIVEVVSEVSEIAPKAGNALVSRYLVIGKAPEWEDIAKKLGYSVDSVKKHHATGLDLVAGILEEKGCLDEKLYTFLHSKR